MENQKILEVHNFKYSLAPFEGYKYRAVIRAERKHSLNYSNINIYTNDNNKDRVFLVIYARTTDKVKHLKLLNFKSKEQDEEDSAIVKQLFKDL